MSKYLENTLPKEDSKCMSLTLISNQEITNGTTMSCHYTHTKTAKKHTNNIGKDVRELKLPHTAGGRIELM